MAVFPTLLYWANSLKMVKLMSFSIALGIALCIGIFGYNYWEESGLSSILYDVM
jgi:hypothetical protein